MNQCEVPGISEESQLAESFKEASKYFSDGQYEKCEQTYNRILSNEQCPKIFEALLNRSSLYCTVQKYDSAIEDCKKYLQNNKKQINPQIYVVYLSSLIKKGEIEQGMKRFKQANQMFPHHKKIADLGKLCKEKSIAEDQDQYIDQMFQKLCMHPKVREYLKDQGFLTKVERMIRNPSLTAALEKMDPRIKEAADAMMMADQNWH